MHHRTWGALLGVIPQHLQISIPNIMFVLVESRSLFVATSDAVSVLTSNLLLHHAFSTKL